MTLTLTISGPLTSGARIYLWSGTTLSTHYSCTTTADGCVLNLTRTIPEDATVTFDAYVASGSGWDWEASMPTTDFESLGAVAVQHVGWTGSITSFTAERTGSNGGNRRYHLLAATSVPVVGYEMTMVSLSTGNLSISCRSGLTECGKNVYFPAGAVVPYEAVVSSGGYLGGGQYSGNIVARETVFVYSGSQQELAETLTAWAYVSAMNEPGSLSNSEFWSLVATTPLPTASALKDTAACLTVSEAIPIDVATKSTAGDVYHVCSTSGLGAAINFALGIVSAGTVAGLVYSQATDPDAYADKSMSQSDCEWLELNYTKWCLSGIDDVGLNPGQVTTADYDGAVNSPTAYYVPDEPWAPEELRPRYTCYDGTEAWSCDGIPGEPIDVEFYVFEDDEWVPQAAASGIVPPTNCLFLDDEGNLRLNEDGTVDTSIRDAKLQTLLEKYGLEDTYEKHHIVTKYSNAQSATRAEVILEMNAIFAAYGLTVESDFNKVVIPHQGPHPLKYHQWVLANLEQIDILAAGDTSLFQELFAENVTNEILSDPSIVLSGYWECR